MSKDRAAPFSKKHRRYWIPVTGGMLLLGALNIGLGMCSYEPARTPERMEVHIPGHERLPGQLNRAEIPANVMRAFAVKYPHTIPDGAIQSDDGKVSVKFPAGGPLKDAVFLLDGTFVSED